MNYQQLGSHGPRVSAIGLGTMGMSDFYGPSDRAESIATIRAALDQEWATTSCSWERL
jgi:aryl-alcohol dehydrogenase-like predicted oxidoreductase